MRAYLYDRHNWIVSVVFLPWLLLLPVLGVTVFHLSKVSISSAFVPVFGRTVLISSAVTLVSVGLGVVFAWHQHRSRLGTPQNLFGILLLPTLAGGLFWGFVGKFITLRSDSVAGLLSNRSPSITFLAILLLVAPQYCGLAAYVTWLRATSLPNRAIIYARMARLSPREVFGDVFWPHCRSLVYALMFFVFLASSTEYATTELALKPSIGTGTASISHWLFEEYHNWLPASQLIAASHIVILGTVAAAGVLSLAMLFVSLCLKAADMFIRRISTWREGRAPLKVYSNQPHSNRSVVGWFAVALTLLPFVVMSILFPPRVVSGAGSLLISAVLCLAVGGLSAAIASGLAMFIRVWNHIGAPRSTNHGAFSIYIAILHTLAIPAIVFGTATLWWFASLSSKGPSAIVGSWAVGHVLRELPLLICFAYWLFSHITDKEIEYQRISHVSLSGLARASFYDRFRQDYLLLWLFGWALAWNDGVINRAAAPLVPSLYSLLSPKLSVRPDFRGAEFCLLFSIAIGLAIIYLWRRMISTLSARSESR
jgi:ABC-type spermidine/putrescine transport system permease subunit I